MNPPQRRPYDKAGRPQYGNNAESPVGRVYVALDTESTGVEADSGEIIEVAAVKFRLEKGGKTFVLDRWQTYVRPKNPIPYKIMHLTGIKQADVQGAPFFSQIEERLRNFIANFPIVGHSIESDVGFLARHNFEVKNPLVDTFELATLLLPQLGNYSLVAVARALNVPSGESHRAMADTLMAMQVFAGLAGKIEELPAEILTEINRIAGELSSWPLQQLFSDAAAFHKRTAELSEGLAMGSLGAKLMQQLAQKTGRNEQTNGLDFAYLLPQERFEPLAPKPEIRVPLDEYGPRVGLVAQTVVDSFQNEKHLLLELSGREQDRAMALLLPAVKVSVELGKTVVIAVNSESQRERLNQRLIPLIEEKILETQAGEGPRRDRKRRGEVQKPFFTASVKPQNNYLCTSRWELFRKTVSLTPDEKKMLIRVLTWLPNTSLGDSSELRITNQERLWSRLNSQKGLCPEIHRLKGGSTYCFFERAKEQAENAHVIIADQALVLANLTGKAGTLPEYDYLIVDEAHHFEEEASRQFGTVVTPGTLFDLLDAVSRPVTWEKQGGHNGFIHTLLHYVSGETPEAIRDLLETFQRQTAEQVELARNAAGNFLQELSAVLTQRNQETGQGDGRLRLNLKFRSGNLWNELAGPWEAFKQDWEDLYYLLRDMRDESSAFKNLLDNPDMLELYLNHFVNALDELLSNLTDAFEGGNQSKVFWIAPHSRTGLVTLFSQPLQVEQTLNRLLFSRKKSVALISSTLTTGGDFSYIKERLGLAGHDPVELRLPPEQDYSGQMLFLPEDMPEPTQPNYQKNIDQYVLDVVKKSKGRTLVLFSSNSALRLTYKTVQRPLEAENILVLGQGLDGTRRSVMERFKNTSRSLLLSTLNYWESNDFQQEDNASPTPLFDTLIITKLPFDPPSDPLFAARTESRIFDDPFMQYSLPRTILRFRQAFERLLASLKTPGVVIMLDSRLTRKSYGPLFLNSFPPLSHVRDNLSQLLPIISDWLSPSQNDLDELK